MTAAVMGPCALFARVPYTIPEFPNEQKAPAVPLQVQQKQPPCVKVPHPTSMQLAFQAQHQGRLPHEFEQSASQPHLHAPSDSSVRPPTRKSDRENTGRNADLERNVLQTICRVLELQKGVHAGVLALEEEIQAASQQNMHTPKASFVAISQKSDCGDWPVYEDKERRALHASVDSHRRASPQGILGARVDSHRQALPQGIRSARARVSISADHSVNATVADDNRSSPTVTEARQGEQPPNDVLHVSPKVIVKQRARASDCGLLKLVVFDFDCTLTLLHVFASLAGNPTTKPVANVPPPHAVTERGQLQRLADLDSHPQWGPGAFAMKSFGGHKRVARLRKALDTLVNGGVECVICSRGLVAPIRKILDQLNLLSSFSQIVGQLGSAFGTSNYDTSVIPNANSDEHYLGSSGENGFVPGSRFKADTIAKCVRDRGLRFSQVVYLDDDIEEIKGAERVCRSFLVTDDTRFFQVLDRLVVDICPCEDVHRPPSSSAIRGERHSSSSPVKKSQP